ncbi:c-type cytochrome [Sphingobium boeckii]|uniref:Cytochrome c n=1 Tax=Sphingobium boeckii TaxID=1082345 RepID=A0A7W9AJQ4_9SPHN|nr:cytochrome c family protein [Sphingobium boeckii]MBB5686679.1 cytochrome c [Sphingobium boeckii]
MNHPLPFAILCGAAVALTLSVADRSTAAAPLPFMLQAATAKGDPAIGAKLFLQCRACHTINVGGRNGVGPNLAGVMGAKAAFHPGYKYSPAMEKTRITWTAATMDAWLKRPSALIPGTKMMYPGMADPKARANMIAYLATLKGK